MSVCPRPRVLALLLTTVETWAGLFIFLSSSFLIHGAEIDALGLRVMVWGQTAKAYAPCNRDLGHTKCSVNVNTHNQKRIHRGASLGTVMLNIDYKVAEDTGSGQL